MARRHDTRRTVMLSIANRKDKERRYMEDRHYGYPEEMRRHRDSRGRFTSEEMGFVDPWRYPMTETSFRRADDYPYFPDHRPSMHYGHDDGYGKQRWDDNRYYDRGEGHSYHPRGEHGLGFSYHGMDKEQAEHCVKNMKNADGSTGEYFSMEEIKNLMSKKGVFEDTNDFYVAMNKAKSKYYPVAKELNMDNQDFYLKIALANLKHHKLNKK